jgi:hypothetical protein
MTDFKICQDIGKDWVIEATTAKLDIETLKAFKKKPKIESRDSHTKSVVLSRLNLNYITSAWMLKKSGIK